MNCFSICLRVQTLPITIPYRSQGRGVSNHQQVPFTLIPLLMSSFLETSSLAMKINMFYFYKQEPSTRSPLVYMAWQKCNETFGFDFEFDRIVGGWFFFFFIVWFGLVVWWFFFFFNMVSQKLKSILFSGAYKHKTRTTLNDLGKLGV